VNAANLVGHVPVNDLKNEIAARGSLQFVPRIKIREVPVRELDQLIKRQRLGEATKLGSVSRADEFVELRPDARFLLPFLESGLDSADPRAGLVVLP
jgi:hypothetical protein